MTGAPIRNFGDFSQPPESGKGGADAGSVNRGGITRNVTDVTNWCTPASPREIVLASLRGQATERVPVVCPGGMMSFAVTEVMRQTGAWWPEAHRDARLMADLALHMQQVTGFDNVGVPFCMTVEAEALGSQVNFGSATVQPWIAREALGSAAEVAGFVPPAHPPGDRRPVVLEALTRLREAAPEVAVFGGLLGPFSLAAQLLEASLLLRAVRRQPGPVNALLRLCTEVATDFALRQVRAGADVVAIADPTATGEILGRLAYQEFAAPYLRQLIGAVTEAGAPVVLHICGCPNGILELLGEMEVGAVSLDETADLHAARKALRKQRLMGNISAELLDAGPPGKIAANIRGILGAGVDILAPACGVTATTPVEHLRVMASRGRPGMWGAGFEPLPDDDHI